VYLGLTLDKDLARITKELSRARGSKSMSNHLRSAVTAIKLPKPPFKLPLAINYNY